MARISEMHYSNPHAGDIEKSEYLEIAVTPAEHAAIQDGSVDFVASFYDVDGSLLGEFSLGDMPIGGVVFDADANEYVYTLDQFDAIDGTLDGNGDGFETGIALTDPDGDSPNNSEAFALTNVTTGEVIDFYDLSSGTGASNTEGITALEGAVALATSGPKTSETIVLTSSPGGTVGSVQFNKPNEDTAVIAAVSQGESGVVCFASGSMIETLKGAVAIEELQVEDFVLTRDNGPQQIRWIGKTRVAGTGNMAPFRISAGAFGLTCDLLVSPNHRIALSSCYAELVTGAEEVLVPIKYLIDHPDVRVERCDTITYVHLLFDKHELVCSSGLWSESLFPGEGALDMMGALAEREVLHLFPELEWGGLGMKLCRPELRRKEIPFILEDAIGL
ncbi:MAG: Hint domain-containing protein [Pseudomonadota bacterium]